ncbi:MAG: Rrf2 family transcriptional regulator [Spirochaetales bacterium]|nr:Rrf2 family transcriptional regulator [Spirochaetales bacterium]
MFSVSTRIRYGLRALAYIAARDTEEPIAIHAIAQEEDISQKYLEHIFNLLKKARIVRSRRGPDGGYFLDRQPEDISAFEIFDALEGPLETVECQLSDDCVRMAMCNSRDFWCDFNNHMTQFLKKKSLEDVLKYSSTEHFVTKEMQV